MTTIRESVSLKLIKVVDTRDKLEVAGKNGNSRYVGIPGTGLTNQCPICGKDHEIHAYVEYPDGRQDIMGTGCAIKVDPSLTVQMKKVELLLKLEVIKKMIPNSFELVNPTPSPSYRGYTQYGVEIDGKLSKLWVVSPSFEDAWDYLIASVKMGPLPYYRSGAGLLAFKAYVKARRSWIRSAERIALLPS